MVKSCVPEIEEQSESDREEFGAVPREHRANQELLKNVFMSLWQPFCFYFCHFFHWFAFCVCQHIGLWQFYDCQSCNRELRSNFTLFSVQPVILSLPSVPLWKKIDLIYTFINTFIHVCVYICYCFSKKINSELQTANCRLTLHLNRELRTADCRLTSHFELRTANCEMRSHFMLVLNSLLENYTRFSLF